jgi:hypothetical protein
VPTVTSGAAHPAGHAATLDTIDNAIDTAVRARRYHRLELIVGAAFAAIAVFALVIGIFFALRQAKIRDTVATHTDCVALVLARYLVDNDASTPAARADLEHAIDAC